MKSIGYLFLLLLNFNFLEAQISFEPELKSALEIYEQAEGMKDYNKSIKIIDQIIENHPDEWLPLYYAILIRTEIAYLQPKSKSFKTISLLESQFEKLNELKPHDSEVLTLRAYFRTIKVLKEPETYQMVLSSAVIKDYSDAIELNPYNPRPHLLLAEFHISQASFWKKDPKSFCSQLLDAKSLFQNDVKSGLSPHWGEKKADDLLENYCR